MRRDSRIVRRAGASGNAAEREASPSSANAPGHRQPGAPPALFKSFFAGGFECSTFIRRSGQRVDVVASTAHDRFARQDYERLRQERIRVAREGVRWHLVESKPGHYDFSSVLPIVRAARATGTQVIWDLCHFGWPGHLDLFRPDFVSSLAQYGAAFASWLAKETAGPAYFVPVNEISYFSWASGEEGSMFPFVTGRGFELKTQLVRAAIQAMDAIWTITPSARFVHVDPVIHVVASPQHPEEQREAEAYRLTQYQAWDMLSGRLWPELGGHQRYLDIIGANFYPHNEWFYNLNEFRRVRKFHPLSLRDPLYRPFREILAEVHTRYRRPLFIAETGAEDRKRSGWLDYVCHETQAALSAGVPVHGICLYPILNHPGWVDDRHCYNALWDYADERGERKIYRPLAKMIRRWRKVFEKEGVSRADETGKQVEKVKAPA